MTEYSLKVDFIRRAVLGLVIGVVGVMGGRVSAQDVILHLKDGDRISGRVVSENKAQVVISNAWVKALRVPLSSIARREIRKIKPTVAKSRPAAKRKKERKPVHPATPKPAAKEVVRAKPKPKPKGKWHGQIRIGMNAIFNTRDQQDYYGDLNMTYVRPYPSHPRQFFRNTSKVHGEYQVTDGKESANRAHISNKSDFDIGKWCYAYGLTGTGYDDVRKVDLQYQVGPGIGGHLVQSKDFVLNVESGLNYEAQYRRQARNLETFYLRFGFDSTWKIMRNLKLTHQLAFYPDMEQEGQYHNEFTSNLSYGFWKNLSLNLTLSDDYNTEVARGVNENRLELRSSLGVTF